jgi:cytochrome b subunit of formate dehydrogenase
MWIPLNEIADFTRQVRAELSGSAQEPAGGKYSLPQKLFHHGIAVLILVTGASGLAMLMRIESPFWTRDPYWLSAATWGAIYALHDLAALLLVPALMLHFYFAGRPEKRHFTRSMLRGWIRDDEYRSHHDPGQWLPDELRPEEK